MLSQSAVQQLLVVFIVFKILYSLKEKGVKDVSKCSESQQHVEVVEIADSFDPKYVEERKCRRTHTLDTDAEQTSLKPAWTLRTSQHLHQSPHIMVVFNEPAPADR